MNEDEPASVTRYATCHTDGCFNAGITITVTVPETVGDVFCGPCSQPITDITDTAPA